MNKAMDRLNSTISVLELKLGELKGLSADIENSIDDFHGNVSEEAVDDAYDDLDLAESLIKRAISVVEDIVNEADEAFEYRLPALSRELKETFEELTY